MMGVCFLLLQIKDVYALEKVLSFREKDGRFEYSLNQNRFMNFQDMQVGRQYEDSLLIRNLSQDQTFQLYLQILPRKQSSLSNTMLENISMQVYYGSDLLYDGKATGIDYSNDGINLQNQILLGSYSPLESKEIHVKVLLDKEISSQSYAIKEYQTNGQIIHSKTYEDVMSQIDWKFVMMYDHTTQRVPLRSGDDSDIGKYIILGGLSLIGLFIVLTHKQEKASEC